MITLQEIEKHCIANLTVRNMTGMGTTELYDNHERRRIALQNLKLNTSFHKALGDKYKEFRRRVEFLVLSMQETINFHMVRLPSGDELTVTNLEELMQALRDGYELTSSIFQTDAFRNPCGEITLSRWESGNLGREGFVIGGSPYSKHLSHAQLRMVGRAAWRRLNLAGRDSVIVEALPHIKLSKSVANKLLNQVVSEPARELVYAFYNQSRQPQWWQQLRSYRGGLRDNTNLRMYSLFVAAYLHDALGIESPMPNHWKTTTVMSLLRNMRESEDFTIMPILADALQDAGCDSEHLLNHYRNLEASFSLGSWIFRATGMI